MEERSEGKVITRRMVKNRMVTFVEGFYPTTGWLYKFLQRRDFSLRMKTSTAQMLPVQEVGGSAYKRGS